MPVSMGILYERCRTVYFISRLRKSAHIHYDRARGDFKLTCAPPCNAVSYFHKTMLRPYSASPEAIERGYADVAESRTIVEMLTKKSGHGTNVLWTSWRLWLKSANAALWGVR